MTIPRPISWLPWRQRIGGAGRPARRVPVGAGNSTIAGDNDNARHCAGKAEHAADHEASRS